MMAVPKTKVQLAAVERVGTELPYHQDVSERAILAVVTLFNKLQHLKTLEPDAKSGRLFNQLFDLVTMSKMTTKEEEKILNDARIQSIIPELRKIWGHAEYLLELDFARKVISSGPSTAQCNEAWEAFPYLDQYRQLARMEYNTLDTALGEKCLPPVRKIAFLGSGPTPFSALCFRERLGPDVHIVNVDRSSEATEHGQKVAEALGEKFCGNMSFVQAEVTSSTLKPVSSESDEILSGANGAQSVVATGLQELHDCDVVHFAALIGDSEEEKRNLLNAVARAMRPGALIMLRSTDSLRQLLYPRMSVDSWDVLSVVTPVLATKYFGGSTSLTSIVVSVEG